jgi:hypothetical protein
VNISKTLDQINAGSELLLDYIITERDTGIETDYKETRD